MGDTTKRDYSKPIAVKELPPTAMVMQGSWGSNDVGTHASRMELFDIEGEAGRGYLEWDIPSMEQTENIGLWYEQRGDKRALTDYDGVMSLPREAAELIEQAGIIVDPEFKE